MSGAMCPFKSDADRISYCNFQCMFYIVNEKEERRCLIKESLEDIINLKKDLEELKRHL
jgi:hypothetical protein